MAFGVGRCLSTPLMVINFILYFISACLAGWALNRLIDGSGVGNAATRFFVPLALIASMVGLASVFAGTHHLRVFRTDSLSAAHATALIAWLLTLLAMGLGAKEIHMGGPRTKRLKVLEAFMIILSLFELLYLLSLHAGIFGPKYGPTYGSGYGNNAAGTGVGGPKAGNYGTPAASAV
ncbi:unnamed protein product [Sphagnum troendelagicum]|uniref:Uncharacterized protein n=1 Tax=Sphagnum troendelagicum TaxID=128251 RepID=A0ABP0UZ29_9BRYO